MKLALCLFIIFASLALPAAFLIAVCPSVALAGSLFVGVAPFVIVVVDPILNRILKSE